MAHKEGSELLSDLEKLKAHIKVGDTFECPGFPEIDYVVANLGFIEKTEEPCLIYKKKQNGQISWVRTLSEYLDKAELKTGKDKVQLSDEIKRLKLRIDEGDECYHYKHPDQLYQIVGVGFIEGDGQPCGAYQAEYGDKITWVRTESEFFAKVDNNGTEIDRFTKVS